MACHGYGFLMATSDDAKPDLQYQRPITNRVMDTIHYVVYLPDPFASADRLDLNRLD